MKLALCCANGELQYDLTRVELFDRIVNETKHMNEGDVLLVYTMNNDSMILDKNIISIILEDGMLTIYNELDNVERILKYECVNYDYYYILLSGMLAEYELKQRNVVKESRAFDKEQYEQAEAAKEKSDYRVYIGSHKFKYIGHEADELVYKVLEALFSDISNDSNGIVITDKNTGKSYKIAYVKAFFSCLIKINDGETMIFEYYKPEKRRELMQYIRKQVIL